MNQQLIEPKIGYVVPRCAKTINLTWYWLFGPKMCSTDALILKLVIWSETVQKQLIQPKLVIWYQKLVFMILDS